VSGRRRRAPKCPYELGDAGTAWWTWAWKTPASKHWDDGVLYTVARRAQLEDERAAIDFAAEAPDLLEGLLVAAPVEAIERVRWALQRLAASATSSTSQSREMRELENQLGLSAKAAKALGWNEDDSPNPKPKTTGVDDIARKRAERRRASRAAGSVGP
jgi:hypothetical protein